jgi:glycerate-2-kinase
MIESALRILGKRVTAGILVAPKGKAVPKFQRRIKVFRSGHPIPDQVGIRAGKQVLLLANQMQEDEMLLCLISGGASAMLPAPVDAISLKDKMTITEQLIRSRATIHEINTVRRHLSKLKGGRLAEECKAGLIISLIVSDVAGNELHDIASGPTAPDRTTFHDAVNVLKKFKVWDIAPRNIKQFFLEGVQGKVSETPKPDSQIFRRVHNFIVAENRTACEAANGALKKMRTDCTILTSSADMEARSMGKLLASIATESQRYGQPLHGPSAILLGGETTVEVKGAGIGGRNQEAILSAVHQITGLRGFAIAALGTDGIDGTSPAAGAIADGYSLTRATRRGLDVTSFLARNDSYNFFKRLDDAIVTGPTGTNVGDLYIVVRAE